MDTHRAATEIKVTQPEDSTATVLRSFINLEYDIRVDVHTSDAVKGNPFGATLIDEDSGESVVTRCYATEELAVAWAMVALK